MNENSEMTGGSDETHEITETGMDVPEEGRGIPCRLQRKRLLVRRGDLPSLMNL
jgi:hypothetical protein